MNQDDEFLVGTEFLIFFLRGKKAKLTTTDLVLIDIGRLNFELADVGHLKQVNDLEICSASYEMDGKSPVE